MLCCSLLFISFWLVLIFAVHTEFVGGAPRGDKNMGKVGFVGSWLGYVSVTVYVFEEISSIECCFIILDWVTDGIAFLGLIQN